jgi:YHS domain-containing protein
MRTMRASVFVLLGLFCLAADTPGTGGDPFAADKRALAGLQDYVGGWRGVGQLQRGSNKGAWIEQADWAWKFSDSHASLVFTSPDSKYYTSGQVLAGPKPGTFEMLARREQKDSSGVGGNADRFSGSLNGNGELVFVANRPNNKPAGEEIARLTLRQVAGGDRLVMLLERRTAGDNQFARLAEIGYTRRGSAFAKGSNRPECVVTGGAGTIAVEHEGRTYYVCCSGCKDLFTQDPAGVLAEYRERKKAGK